MCIVNSAFDDIEKYRIIGERLDYKKYITLEIVENKSETKEKDINFISHNEKTLKIMNNDTKKLLEKANDILELENIEVVDVKIGARASSVDYFPMLGNLIDSKNSFKSYPHIKNGAFIKDEQLVLYENLYTLNGVGGRGFVLAPYLANILSEFVVNGEEMPKEVLNYRLFKRWAKKEGKSL